MHWQVVFAKMLAVDIVVVEVSSCWTLGGPALTTTWRNGSEIREMDEGGKERKKRKL